MGWVDEANILGSLYAPRNLGKVPLRAFYLSRDVSPRHNEREERTMSTRALRGQGAGG